MSGENSKTSFWEVLTKNSIEVPVIQRDYAQGRINDRVNQIRDRFVTALLESLIDLSKPALHLDFIYGRIDGKNEAEIKAKNEEAINRVLLAVKGYAGNLNLGVEYKIDKKNNGEQQFTYRKLIPLDGQQRLTTLYLLHWYLLQRSGQLGKVENLKYLKGFRYKTRKSTMEFCEYLTNEENVLKFEGFFKGVSISQQIEKSISFYKVWKNDPSVQGMLVMLDEIHTKLRHTDEEVINLLWQRLIDGNRVTFDFLDLDKLEQTDQLYVKMNARGKQLTDFEHFKAWLQDYIKGPKDEDEKLEADNWNEILSKTDWEEKVDSSWLDLFWKNRAKNVYEVDETIYNFFKSINLYYYLSTNKKDEINLSLLEKIRESNPEKNFIPVKQYLDSGFFSIDSLLFLFKSLDSLVNFDSRINAELEDIFCFPFSSNNVDNKIYVSDFLLKKNQLYPSLPDRAYYYAFLLFINDISKWDEDIYSKFKDWMRICRNLIYNTYIQSPSDFIGAIPAIFKIAKNKFTIKEDIKNDSIEIPFFDAQAKKERRKLLYFEKGKIWEEKILEYENHSYFYGDIDFIFNLLGGELEDYELFVHYGDKLSNYFGDVLNNNYHKLLLGMLTLDDYWFGVSGSKRGFCLSKRGTLRDRNDNWRKVFDDNGTKFKTLKKLITNKNSLDNILAQTDLNDWRYFFVTEPAVVTYCQEGYFQHGWNGDIKLLRSTDFRGRHADLYTYYLYCKLHKTTLNSLFIIDYIDINGHRYKDHYPILALKPLEKYPFNVLEIWYEPEFELDVSKSGFVINIQYISEEDEMNGEDKGDKLFHRFIDLLDFEEVQGVKTMIGGVEGDLSIEFMRDENFYKTMRGCLEKLESLVIAFSDFYNEIIYE